MDFIAKIDSSHSDKSDSIPFYESVLKSFFVENEQNIKRIYDSIRQNRFPHNRIECVDVNMAMHLYEEYRVGLEEFVTVVCAVHNEDDVNVSAIHNKLEIIKNKDCSYIESIFGGVNNKPRTEDISTAMSRVECSIEALDQMKTLQDNVNSHSDINGDLNEELKSVISDTLKVYNDSINNYLYYLVKEIFKIFNSIIESMNNRTPVGGVKEVPTMQIF